MCARERHLAARVPMRAGSGARRGSATALRRSRTKPAQRSGRVRRGPGGSRRRRPRPSRPRSRSRRRWCRVPCGAHHAVAPFLDHFCAGRRESLLISLDLSQRGRREEQRVYGPALAARGPGDRARDAQKGKGPEPFGTGPPWEGDVFVLSNRKWPGRGRRCHGDPQFFSGYRIFFEPPGAALPGPSSNPAGG